MYKLCRRICNLCINRERKAHKAITEQLGQDRGGGALRGRARLASGLFFDLILNGLVTFLHLLGLRLQLLFQLFQLCKG